MAEATALKTSSTTDLRINTLLQLFSYFEKGKFLFRYEDISAGLGVATDIRLIIFDEPAAKSSNLDAVAFDHGHEKRVEDGIN